MYDWLTKSPVRNMVALPEPFDFDLVCPWTAVLNPAPENTVRDLCLKVTLPFSQLTPRRGLNQGFFRLHLQGRTAAPREVGSTPR